MRRIGAVALVVLGVAGISLGLLFLMGAAGKGSRVVVAVLGLALGGASTGLGVRLWKAARAWSPEQLRAEVLALARSHDGALSAGELEAALGARYTAALPVLDTLERQGLLARERRDGVPYLVFPELMPRLLVRRCTYCKAELPLSSGDPTHCPNCGGTVQTRRERREAGSDLYGLDE